MVKINAEGLEVAPLSARQLEILNNAQKQLNKDSGIDQEIILLAVTR